MTESSIIAVQIFDQKKFKKKDQGFLGVINIRVGDVIDIMLGGDGSSLKLHPWHNSISYQLILSS